MPRCFTHFEGSLLAQPTRRGRWRALIAVLLALCAWAAAPTPALAQTVTEDDLTALGIEAPEDETAAARTAAGAEKGEPLPAPPSLGALAARMVLSLGAVFALMTGVLWAARRWFPRAITSGSRGTTRAGASLGAGIEILASRGLGQRRQLLIVRAMDKTLLLGATPHAVAMLAELDQEPVSWQQAAVASGLEADLEPEPAPKQASRFEPRLGLEPRP